MNIREKLVIKLVVFLINFIGKGIEEYYGYKLDEVISDLDTKD